MGEWKTSAIREMLTTDSDCKRNNCFICGKHKEIAELHHVIPVSQITAILNMGIVELKDISTPVVWLCPNHHAYVHKAMNGETSFLINCLSEEEISNLLKILETYENSFKKLTDKYYKSIAEQ